jgi:hypothetical protein
LDAANGGNNKHFAWFSIIVNAGRDLSAIRFYKANVTSAGVTFGLGRFYCTSARTADVGGVRKLYQRQAAFTYSST